VDVQWASGLQIALATEAVKKSMKTVKNLLLTAALLVGSVGLSLRTAKAVDPCLGLPDYPANQITFKIADYYPTAFGAYSYLTADVQSGPVPAGPGLYASWCADGQTFFPELNGNGTFSTVLTGWLLSSCDLNLNSKLDPDHPANCYVSPEIWRQINWILNHRGSTQWWDVQDAIWKLVGGPTPWWNTSLNPFPINSATVSALLASASADVAWSPHGGDSVAAIIDRDPNNLISYDKDKQLIFIELGIPCTANVTPQATAFCAASVSPVTLTANNNLGPVATYIWKDAGGNTVGMTKSIQVTPSSTPGLYTYTVTVSNGKCSVGGWATITVNPTPNVTVNSEIVCLGIPVTLRAEDANGNTGDTYLWSPGGATTQEITVTPGSTTTYTVTVKNASGCSAIASGKVTIQACQFGATRTIGYWQTHLDGMKAAIANGCVDLGVLTVVPSGSQDLTLTKMTVAEAEAVMWGKIGGRTALGQARMQLGQQLVGAMINSCLLATSPQANGFSPTLLSDARAALDGNNISLILSLEGQLDKFNNSGDSIPIAASYGSAKPQDSKAAAAKTGGVIDPGPAFK